MSLLHVHLRPFGVTISHLLSSCFKLRLIKINHQIVKKGRAMKNKNNKKLIVASMLVAGATVGGTAIASNQRASATSNKSAQTETSETRKKPELSEEKKAEIKAKLDAMTDEEKQEWLENHKPQDGGRPKNGKRHGKPSDLTDEEWEQKKAELKEKLDAMTDEERKEWLESHKPKDGERPERPTDSSSELPSEE